MNRSVFRSTDYALLILRLATVFVFLPHGIGKALDWPMATSMFAGMGFPGFLGPITGIVEVIASLLLLVLMAFGPSAIAIESQSPALSDTSTAERRFQ